MNTKKVKIIATSLLVVLLPVIAIAHGISEADKQSMLDGGYIRYVWLGARHMLTGYDHLLFIFGVIFFLTGMRDIVKYITAFTLGHSITLVSATLLGITANYYLIDAAIALSVCYKGFENLDGFNKYLGRPSPNLMMVIFGFGLIHGFGLSTRLQQLPLGDTGLIGRILSFNVGVEVGQIIALAIMLLVISGWRRTQSFAQFSTISNGGLIAAGVFLFLMQIHGYEHLANANEFTNGIESAATVDPQEVAKKIDWEDTITLTIPAKSGKEYKLYLKKGATFEYAWRTNNEKLYFDFHGEPKGDTTGYFESFEVSNNNQSSGSLTTTFEGTHGWYWQNNSPLPVSIELKVKGEYQRIDLKS